MICKDSSDVDANFTMMMMMTVKGVRRSVAKN